MSAARQVLLVAYQCGPGMGSVSQIGWEWYQRLAKSEQVTLVTHVRNREALEAAGAPLGNSQVRYIDSEFFAGPLYRLARRLFPQSEHSVFLVSSLDYFVFDWLAWRMLAAEQKAGARWAVLHRVTPVTAAAPTWLARLGIPTVLGPLNSGLSDPPGFAEVLRAESTWLVGLRRLGSWFDRVLGSSRRAACILTATASTEAQLPASGRRHCQRMGENGVDLERFVARPWPQPPGRREPLRILFVGRLIPAKALPLLLDALAELLAEGYSAVLTVVGDGPLRQAWESYANERQLGRRVLFLGALPAVEVANQMQACHVLCLPSVRESGGAVLLEAMASARPVIAVNFGGPAEVVDLAVGALVDPESPPAVAQGIAACLRDVIRRPKLWQRRGEAARRRVEALHAWPAKVAQARALYGQLIAAGEPS